VQLVNGVYIRAPSALKTENDATKVPPVNILAPLQPYHAPPTLTQTEYKEKSKEKEKEKEKEKSKGKEETKEAAPSNTGVTAREPVVRSSPPLPPITPPPALNTNKDSRGNAEVVSPLPQKLDFVFAQPTNFPSRDAPKK
jgi:hypothetical protein